MSTVAMPRHNAHQKSSTWPDGVRRLWLVEESSAWENPPFRLAPYFRLALSWQRSEMWVRLDVRVRTGN